MPLPADSFSFTIELRDDRYHVLRNGWPVGSASGHASEWDARKVIEEIKRWAVDR